MDSQHYDESLFSDLEDIHTEDFVYDEEEQEVLFLNNKDYNLNSPIILDNYDDLLRIEKGLPTETTTGRVLLELNQIKNVRDQIRMETRTAYTPLPPKTEVHKHVVSKFIRGLTALRRGTWYQLITHVAKISEETKKICENYLDMELPLYLDKLKCRGTEEMFLYGEKFWYFHKLVLIMNHSGPGELKHLCEKMKIKDFTNVKNNPALIRTVGYLDPSVGKCYIFENFIYWPDLNLVLPRNMILMIKDIFISRFQNMLSMALDLDHIYNIHDINKMEEIYLVGDNIIGSKGNIGYDLVKMVEPICSLGFYNLSRKVRPLIPKFSEYEEHINTSVENLSYIHPGIKTLCDAILSIDRIETLLIVYGSFRHWGHPFIEYEEGLDALHTQVTMEKEIDEDYANALASDLAFKILKKGFFEQKKWFVSRKDLNKNDKMYDHVVNNTWPTYSQILEYGDNWHKLPLEKYFEIPDLIDPSAIYSDKAHSMGRQELIDYLQNNKKGTIKTYRVLNTMLSKEATDWKKFFQQVNDEGLPDDVLIIGLKAKEREMKRIGRFFSLMSWELREYFVSTEYLIKKYYVPLFKGLTMADGLMTVVKKMIDSSCGQGNLDYNTVSIANHIDYTKWNNHQRRKSNHPVFTVMGQFLGYPNLITRTHEFFEKSWIYYAGRADKIWTDGRRIYNQGSGKYCWDGQAGGLEGLRQKGWTILNYLVIERESKRRNTLIKVLAQGDNQTITTTYKTQVYRTEDELKSNLEKMVENNQSILDSIISGTKKLGLIINKDETVQAADYMNYGKVPIYRGVIRGLTGKRWSRANFVTNDQLPSLSNVISSVSTNALTVCHFSKVPFSSIYLYNFIGTLGLELLTYHNPALRSNPHSILRDGTLIKTPEFRALALFLDPSIGGVSGTNLNRFMIRMFPDPVTESLSFWKRVHDNTKEKWIKELAITVGYPEIKSFEIEDLDKLIEDPTSLNIKHGINVANVIKEEIKKQLINNIELIRNEIMQHCAVYLDKEESQILAWLRSIKPLFPRFISELYNSTFLGTVKNLLGLFINSRTIRNVYRKKYRSDLDNMILKSELISLSNMILIVKKSRSNFNRIWDCSSNHADRLRRESWGQEIVGMTVPHPSEILSDPIDRRFCKEDEIGSLTADCITILHPYGIPIECRKGPYVPYLGSNTSEGTSILTPWEKETNIPMIQRATKLRDTISWFVEPDSNLSRSIMNNLESLTGISWNKQMKGYKRTGSAIHRFSSSRVSSGGFAASSPWGLSWMISTTDTLKQLNDKNYDFMFQSLLLWSQIRVLMLIDGQGNSGVHHCHIKCESCIREIDEIVLDAPYQMKFQDVSTIVRKWIPGDIDNSIQENPIIELIEGDWAILDDNEKSFQIGMGMGFVFGDMCLTGNWHMSDSSLYPISLRNKLIPIDFFNGLLTGVLRSASIHLISRRNLLKGIRSDHMLWGTSNYVLETLSEQEQFIMMLNLSKLYQELIRLPHKVPCSYPPSLSDCGIIFRNYMRQLLIKQSRHPIPDSLSTWIFSDLQSPKIMYPYILSKKTCKIIMRGYINQRSKDEIRELQGQYIDIIHGKVDNLLTLERYLSSPNTYVCSSEIRHAAKDISTKATIEIDSGRIWGQEYAAHAKILPMFYGATDKKWKNTICVPKIQNPLISSMRIIQLSTGAHFKLRALLTELNLKYCDFICGGDGSGGMTSCLLRYNKFSKGIFNSLLEMENQGMKGSRPPPPSAVMELGGDAERCVNLYSAWEEPSDLKSQATWESFIKNKCEHKLNVDLMVFDMEVRDQETSNKIEENIIKYTPQIMRKGVVIYKTYVSRILSQESPLVTYSSKIFYNVNMGLTEVTSSQSSEVYLICYFDSNQIQSIIEKPDYEKIEKILSSESFVFKTEEEEFRRALRLRTKNMEMGVPKELIVDPSDELIGIFISYGLHSGYAMHIIKQNKDYQGLSSTSFVFSLVTLTLNNILNFTDHNYNDAPLPSDKQCQKVGSLWCGFLNWLSLCIGDIRFHSKSNILIKRGFTIIKSPKNRKSIQISITPGKIENKKHLYLDNAIGDIGAITRTLIRAFGFQGDKIRSKVYNYLIIQYNKNLVMDVVRRTLIIPGMDEMIV
ncbi:polymerase [Inhangapi virus]|uniref:RNA-directed RNA polymerase L n=1 Tax=Inhangapi virus TaxID=1620892 RepID=A0A0D3R164_9RHAB|nr:L [Inhangapi virus] [Inhangapi virus]YP_010796341.1 polymerase [Inhangapi virus]AJR28341.1 polymerase [Inhangapi virus]ALJ94022.1 L [Inhangapi virus] [Inhangapi virus]